ncbi:hypothetical protein J6590_027676 [Homalodisca vitripennis]|nr:hypothetical protein J6590_027676 [Homalodisca vitripennis]
MERCEQCSRRDVGVKGSSGLIETRDYSSGTLDQFILQHRAVNRTFCASDTPVSASLCYSESIHLGTDDKVPSTTRIVLCESSTTTISERRRAKSFKTSRATSSDEVVEHRVMPFRDHGSGRQTLTKHMRRGLVMAITATHIEQRPVDKPPVSEARMTLITEEIIGGGATSGNTNGPARAKENVVTTFVLPPVSPLSREVRKVRDRQDVESTSEGRKLDQLRTGTLREIHDTLAPQLNGFANFAQPCLPDSRSAELEDQLQDQKGAQGM